jgi:hypothetical protein
VLRNETKINRLAKRAMSFTIVYILLWDVDFDSNTARATQTVSNVLTGRG